MLSEKLLEAAGNSTQPVYIEDVFSTYLYTGNNSTNTITNGIDLSTKGGMVWLKDRSASADNNIYDTARGVQKYIVSNSTSSQSTAGAGAGLTAFNSTGFTLGTNWNTENWTNDLYASWTFRKQPKFFDIVTYTGNGVGGRNINHNLGSAPGCIIIKCTSTTSNWMVWHRSISGQNNLRLNTTDGVTGVTDPISVPGFPGTLSTTQFTVDVGTGSDLCNVNGATYVAYLFAHDAGGFGATGTDNVISCGSTGTGSTTKTVNLGYEPQWLLIKNATTAEDWYLVDNMRGFNTSSGNPLFPNLSNAEASGYSAFQVTSTGFNLVGVGSSDNYIYIAIRRGPMKTPTTGTSVFKPETASTDNSYTSAGFPVDWMLEARRNGDVANTVSASRLTGGNLLVTSSTAAQSNSLSSTTFTSNTGVKPGYFGTPAGGIIFWQFQRAPGFFDVVCYTGTGTAQNVTHNLGVVPELMIIKRRDSATGGVTYSKLMSPNKIMQLFSNFGSDASFSEATIINTDPTSITFNVRTDTTVNASGGTYVAYLFASCPGVSKVGTYTGNGSSQTINCGFTAGARYVLIKRTDSTGDWYVWDTARGMVAGNDPHLSLNSTAAEVTTDDSVDTDNSGFIVNQLTATNINVSSATYIYLAIA